MYKMNDHSININKRTRNQIQNIND